MPNKPDILFFYTELAEYFLVCARKLVSHHGYEVHVVCWPVNKEAPFQLNTQGLNMHARQDYNRQQLLQLAQDLDPKVVVCSGWIDKDYKKVCKALKATRPVVVTADNQWRGTAKQRLATKLSSMVVQPYYSHAWVTGVRQKEFLKRLGFSEDKIKQGFYTADVDYFLTLYHKYQEKKKQAFPKRFLYVGRYVEHKGVNELWQAFIKLVNEGYADWELWCIGTGDLFDQRVEHPNIKHFGFVQPTELEPYIADSGVFVLPSKYEPWGVVLHEYAAAGFPLICTHEVGASTEFIVNGENGYILSETTTCEIYEAMLNVVQCSDDVLNQMGARSVELARRISPDTWCATLNEFVKEKERVN